MFSNRTSTVHTLEEWNAIIEHEVRSFAKALQSLKKQLQPFIEEEPSASIDGLQSSFNRVERQIRSVVTILENPDPVFEAWNDFAHEFETLVEELRTQPEDRAAIASEISDSMITVATAVKNADFLIFKGKENGPEMEEEEVRKGSFIFGQDSLSLQMKANGVTHTGVDGKTRNLTIQDLPPVLDLETLVWKLDAEAASEQNKFEFSAPPLKASTFSPQSPAGNFSQLSIARPDSPTVTEAKSSPKPSSPRAADQQYATFQMSSLEKGFGDHLANFTAESARFWKWLCLDPAERTPEKGRLHFHSMLKHVNHICAQSSTPTLGIDKQVQKLTSNFQMIDTKNGEPIPRFMMQQVTETLISLAGIIKGTIALNILNKRNVIFLAETKKERPKIQSSGNTVVTDATKPVKVFRIMVVGHDGVGKSTLIRKFCQKETANITPTQGVELKVYKFLLDGEYVELQILDAAGKRFFRDILDEFYQVVEGIMIVYDITSSESFGDIHLWMRGMEKFTFLQKIIVGNKGDLGNTREVQPWRAQNLAEEYNVQYIEASCESGVNVEECFLTLIRNIQASVKPTGQSDDEADGFVDIEVSDKAKLTRTHSNSVKTTNSMKSSPRANIKKLNKYTFFTTL